MKKRITSLVIVLTLFYTQTLYAMPVIRDKSHGITTRTVGPKCRTFTCKYSGVINYESFDLASDESIYFYQDYPENNIIINRIFSGSQSNIDGYIQANGNLVFMNPNGILFGNNARVNVRSLIATTKDTPLYASYSDITLSGDTTGTIVNDGLIEAVNHVGLIAANVENRGTIRAGGDVALIGSSKGDIYLDFVTNGLINFAADSSEIGDGSIKNSGTIQAGQVLLTAHDVNNVLENVINNTGIIEATKAVTGEDGSIILVAEGSIINTGDITSDAGHIIIDATGDVTSHGILKANKLTEKGASFSVSGSFEFPETDLRNDNEEITFVGDTYLYGTVSHADNISVADGVTLTMGYNVTLQAGTDTSTANTDGGYVWMGDDSLIKSYGPLDANLSNTLTVETTASNSWLGEIYAIRNVNIINANDDKTANPISVDLKHDILVRGDINVDDGIKLFLNPAGTSNDISMTASSFNVGGNSSNAGSIELNNKNLKMESTSWDTNNTVNFFVNDRINNTVYSTGSLTFIGKRTDDLASFNIGLSGTDITAGNKIMVKGITLGAPTYNDNAKIELDASISELSAAADTGGALTMYQRYQNGYSGSTIILNGDTTISAKTFNMSQISGVDAKGHDVTFYATGEGSSNIGSLESVDNLSFKSSDFGAYYSLFSSSALDGVLTIGESTRLNLGFMTAANFAFEGTGAKAGAVEMNYRNTVLNATSTDTDSAVNFYINDQFTDTAYAPGFLKFVGTADTKFVIGVSGNDTANDNTLMFRGIVLGDDAGSVVNLEVEDSISEISAAADTGHSLVINNGSKLVLNTDTTLAGTSIQIGAGSLVEAGGNNLVLFAIDGESGNYVSDLEGVNDLSLLGNTTGLGNSYELNANLDISGVFHIGDSTHLILNPLDAMYDPVTDIVLKADRFTAAGIGERVGSILLNNKNVTLDATSTNIASDINFYLGDQLNNTVYSAGSLTFLGNENTKFNIGVANNDSVNNNKIMVQAITLGNNFNENPVRVANVELAESISEFSATADCYFSPNVDYGGAIRLLEGENGIASTLTLNTDTSIIGTFIQMRNNTAINANGHDLSFHAVDVDGVSSLTQLDNVNNLSLYSPSSFIFGKDIDISGTLKVQEGSYVSLFPMGDDSPVIISDISLKADKFVFDGYGPSAAYLYSEHKNLTLEATSQTEDSIVNFWVNDKNTDTVYSEGSFTFLGDENTKFLVGIADNDTPTGNTIMVNGFMLGDAVGKVANVEIADAVSQLSATAFTGDDFVMYNASGLILNSDMSLVGKTIQIDSAATIDANNNNITIYSQGDSSLGGFTDLKDITMIDGIVDGNQIQYELFSDSINARNVNLGADVKLRGMQTTTTINAENLSMAGNSQLTSWDPSWTHNDMVLNVTNIATLGQMIFFDDLTFSGGASYALNNNLEVDGAIRFISGSDAVLGSGVSSLTAGGDVVMDAGSRIALGTSTIIEAGRIDSNGLINMADGSEIDATNANHSLTLKAAHQYDSQLDTLTNMGDLSLGNSAGATSPFVQFVYNPAELNAQQLNLGDNTRLTVSQSATFNLTDTVTSLTSGTNSILSGYADGSFYNDNSLIVNAAGDANLNGIGFFNNLTLAGGGSFVLDDNFTTIQMGGNFVLGAAGDETSLIYNGLDSVFINPFGSFIMEQGSSMVMTNDTNLHIKISPYGVDGVLYNIDTGAGDLILSSAFRNNTVKFIDAGTIVCSNNNTPVLQDAVLSYDPLYYEN